jgi:hypothetical protein
MILNKLLQKNHITLWPDVYNACKEGIRRMSKSPDPLHNHHHILSILKDLDIMLSEDHEINWEKVNFNVLLLAITWHDIWKAQRLPKSRKKLVYYWFAEGIGSMRLFSKETKKYHLDPLISKKVRYAIRKHPPFQFLPKRTIESKILKSLDELEDFSIDRFKEGLNSIHELSEVSPRLASFFRLYYQHWISHKNGYGNKYSWSRIEYQKRKHVFFSQIWPTLRDYLKNISKSNPQLHFSLPAKNQS